MFVALANAAQAIATGAKTQHLSVGPFDLSFTTTQSLIFTLSAAVVMLGFTLVSYVFLIRLSVSWERGLRMKLVTSYLYASWEERSRFQEGELQDLAINQTVRAANAIGGRTILILATLSTATLLVSAAILAPLGTLIITVGGGLMLTLFRPLNRRVRGSALRNSGTTSTMAESVASLSRQSLDYSIFGVEESAVDNVQEKADLLAHDTGRLTFLTMSSPQIFQALGVLLIILILTFLQRQDRADVASVGAVGLLLIRSLSYGQQLQSARQRIKEAEAYVHRVTSTIQRYAASTERSDGVVVSSFERLEVQDARYRYGDESPLLGPFDLALERGQIVGIAGPSGAGKSTLAHLVLGLRPPSSGTILVNGRPIEETNLRSIRATIGYVPQDVELLTGSVRENVRFFRPEIADTSIERSLEQVGLKATGLGEHGLDSLVGPGERRLSGGQLQRLGIARALCGGAEVILLDEPTSALDERSEDQVLETLLGLRGQGISILIISHRQRTLDACDRIFTVGVQ